MQPLRSHALRADVLPWWLCGRRQACMHELPQTDRTFCRLACCLAAPTSAAARPKKVFFPVA